MRPMCDSDNTRLIGSRIMHIQITAQSLLTGSR